ncbi:MAG: STAS domain-containing protein, partial [Oceanococcaceae bacterium]
LFGAALIEQIPLAALIGVMFVVCEKTFEWSSFRLFGRVPKPDIFVGLLVAAVTVIADLAIAVVVGVVVSALVFAWQQAKRTRVQSRIEADGHKLYTVEGTLFFASTTDFLQQFSTRADPEQVEVDFSRARLADHSALEAVNTLAERYQRAGKTLRVRHLSADCRALLDRAGHSVATDRAEPKAVPSTQAG